MSGTTTYNLSPVDGGKFYKDLSDFTNAAWLVASFHLGTHASNYREFVKANETEPLRSVDEYLLELVITGILVKNYYGKAQKSGNLFTGVLTKLYALRSRYQTVKPLIDRLRGIFGYMLLERKPGVAVNWTLKGLLRLLQWLRATGEFNEEVMRFHYWISYYRTKTRSQFRSLIKTTVYIADYMDSKGEEVLGKYVCRVPHFLQTKISGHRFREDYFFVSRGRNEYFMNMFGAEVLNRQMRAQFKQMPHKAVLLPTCMRTVPDKGCGAKHDGKELVCMQCSRDCNVGKIATIMRKQKVTCYLIPHSSGFSRFLRKWQDNRETGLVGVTCILNLLSGGYEMKRRNISAQCIFLDYCACKKHWDHKGIPTTLNIAELVSIVQ